MAASGVIKGVSNYLTSVWKKGIKLLKKCNNKYRYFSCVNKFWTVLNNGAINTVKIKDLTKRIEGESTTTFDFSTF